MRVAQISICFIVVFITCSSVVFSVTTVDLQLKNVYRGLGFSRRDVNSLCGQLNGLIIKLFGFERLKHRGVSAENLCAIMQAGMLIELSEYGHACIQQAAQEFADNVNGRKFPLSSKATRLLRAEVKKFTFSWIINRLRGYESISFLRAYDSIDIVLADQPSDFKAYVAILDDLKLADEFGWLGI